MGKARSTPRGIAEVVTPDAAPPYTDDADFDPDEEARRTAVMLGDLALLNGTITDDVDWIIYRVRTADEIRAVPGKPREMVTKKHGAMDLGELAREVGGGTFDLYPYYDTGDGNGKCIRKRFRETFAGPRIDYTLAPVLKPAPVVAAAPSQELVPSGGPNGTHQLQGLTRLERILIHQGRQMDKRFMQMMQAVLATAKTPAAAPAQQMGPGEMLAVVKGLHELGRDVAPERRDMDPMAIGKLIFEATNAGVMLGQSREPLPAGSDGEGAGVMPIIEKALDVFGQFLQSRPQARPRSEAHVVPGPQRDPAAAVRVPTQPPPPSPAGVPPSNDIPHQWHTAISALYRAQAQNDDPRDFAETLRGILRSDEVDDLVNNTEAMVGRLAPVIAGYPQLATAQGQQYFLAVLAELRSPTAGDDDLDGAIDGVDDADGLAPAGLEEPDGLHIG